jgi:hypothetical protein
MVCVSKYASRRRMVPGVLYDVIISVNKGIVNLDSEGLGTQLPFMLAWMWSFCGMSVVVELGTALLLCDCEVRRG